MIILLIMVLAFPLYVLYDRQNMIDECKNVCEKNNIEYVYYETAGSYYRCYCIDSEDNLIEKLVKVR